MEKIGLNHQIILPYKGIHGENFMVVSTEELTEVQANELLISSLITV